jgi:AraC-like DNA-binding protein
VGEDSRSHWQAARFIGVTTEVAPVKERFDFWHALFPHIDMRRTTGEDGYRAAALACAGDDGIAFTDLVCAPTASRFYDGRVDHMQLCVIAEGQFGVVHGRDERLWLGPGAGLQLLDCHRTAQTYSEISYRAYHITRPRAAVYRAMGGDPIAGTGALRSLPDTPLALLLKDQLGALARHGPNMNAAEAAAAMKLLSGLALTFLEGFNTSLEDERKRIGDAHFASACRLIEAQRGDAGLTADTIAQAIGCSRASLYRLFEQRGLSVAEHIRAVRLNHGRALLRDPRLGIGDIALRCGYDDLSAFGKAFRRRFGMTPRDWRMTVS